MTTPSTRQTLRKLAEARRGVLVPGAFNALSARVIEDLGFEAIYVTGADGIQFEDQVSPKRCSHFSGKEVISADEMVGKIKAAVDARIDPDLQ